MYKVLVVDDNPAIGTALKVLLGLHNIECRLALTPQAALIQLREDPTMDLIIQDMNFTEDTTSGEEGKLLFQQLRAQNPMRPIILLTAWTHLESAVELVKQGAADYIAKPWDNQKLIKTIQQNLAHSAIPGTYSKADGNTASTVNEQNNQYDLCGLVYQSEAMADLVDRALRIAKTDLPVLIGGPNGSGKEKIAEIIQTNSAVADGPFVRVNVGALPKELIEAELFGAEAGAYTGLNKQRIGRFEMADKGTLFLDELGTLSAEGQAKLLRVVQTGEYQRLGSSQTRRVNVRVVSATNMDLPQAIKDGHFREDLYYRLNVMELYVPALRDRQHDIAPLLQFFLKRKRSDAPLKIEPLTLKALQQYHWPGNVRELENACQRALLFCEADEFTCEHFGLNLTPTTGEKAKSLSVEPTRPMIEAALAENDGIIAHAAKQLGLTRQALYRRIEKYQIESPKQ